MSTVIFDDSEYRAMMQRMRALIPEHIRISMAQSMRHIGLVATSKYMTRPAFDFESKKFAAKERDDVLAIRTGRLARSLTDGFAFTTGDMTGVPEGVRTVQREGDRFVGIYGTTVPYAGHEYGIRGIRARPYLRPAAQESVDEVAAIFQHNMRIATTKADK